AAGINKWLSTRYKSLKDPGCRNQAYMKNLRVTPLDIWSGVYVDNILASTGHFVPEITSAAPPLPSLPIPATPTAATVNAAALKKALRGDVAFGSNATAVGGADTSTHRGMLLGNPHFPWTGQYRFTQQQLTIPGVYNVAGASLIGSPVVNIGWNSNVAWSHTVSTAYRFTPYEYTTIGDGQTYLTPSGLKKVEKRTVVVTVKGANGMLSKVTKYLYRTPQGYVLNSSATLMLWTPLSFWAIRDANGEQLRTIDTFLNMGMAKNVRDLLHKQDQGGGMPWVNTIAADRAGNVLYADHSVVPNVSNAMANQCMTVIGRLQFQLAGLPGLNGNLADSTCKWGSDADAQRPGIFGPSHLPAVVRRDWVMNANDSYWLPNPKARLEGYARIIGCEQCVRTFRTKMVMTYVLDQLKRGPVTPATLRSTEYKNREFTAQVARAGGALDQVCAQTGETEWCKVLHNWDGRSNATSVGTEIFEAFATRLPSDAWKVPFSASDPLNTPRTLSTASDVVQAMKTAIDSLKKAGVNPHATWGSLHVAGDRGAPAIPITGGEGDASGNANATMSRSPQYNTKYYSPVNYGSSHIQEVAFIGKIGMDIHTILTYSQYEDPTSPYSSDQTRMFSRKQWVVFPWTPAQISKQLVQTINLWG
ncbi:MAG TPA: penicillin acylase family protein, partial [Marmoricola sp.]|nr:penicillin acylase family protein [Marmoricola sp.]